MHNEKLFRLYAEACPLLTRYIFSTNCTEPIIKVPVNMGKYSMDLNVPYSMAYRIFKNPNDPKDTELMRLINLLR